VRARALELVASARHLPAGSGPSAIRIGAAGKTLTAELPGLEVLRVDARPGGAGAMMMGDLPGAFAVTLTVEESAGMSKPDEVREQRWTKGAALTPLKKTNVRLSSRGDLAVVDYLIPKYEDLEIRQRHVHGYLLRDSVMGELHVSKIKFVPEDGANLQRILGSARLE
jgi:hypothetical protein